MNFKVQTKYTLASTSKPSRVRLEQYFWHDGLPLHWTHAVVIPQEFCRYDEYEISAHKVLGVDAQGLECFCMHEYIDLPVDVTRREMDMTANYAEKCMSWRLKDGRWLRYTLQIQGGQATGFYTFTPDRPR